MSGYALPVVTNYSAPAVVCLQSKRFSNVHNVVLVRVGSAPVQEASASFGKQQMLVFVTPITELGPVFERRGVVLTI